MNKELQQTKTNTFLSLIKNNYGNIVLLLSVVLMILGLFFNHRLALASMLIVWTNSVIYALPEIRKNIVFLIFHGTFAIFLLGRFVSTGVFGYDTNEYSGLYDMNFSNWTVKYIMALIFCSLLFLFISYYRSQNKRIRVLKSKADPYSLINVRIKFVDKIVICFKKLWRFLKNRWRSLKKSISKIEESIWSWLLRKRDITSSEVVDRSNFKVILGKVSLVLFYVFSIFEVIYLINLIKYTREVGYNTSYLLPNPWAGSIIFVVGSMYSIAFFTYLSTLPRRKNTIIPILVYIFIGVLYLLAGRRKDFMLNILIVITYIILRIKNDKAVLKKIIVPSLVAVPILIVILSLVESIRQNNIVGNKNIFEVFLDFFYGQGVSARVIGYGILFRDIFPEGKLYSIGTILEFIKYNLIGKIILGNPIPSDQSIDRALNGHLFSQAVAYLAYPKEYLQGLGIGSSYIAELFVDFRVIGVIIGSFLYGKFIIGFNKGCKSSSYITMIFSFLMIRGFYFTPRSGYLSFITTAFSPRLLLGLVIILIAAYIVNVIVNIRKNRLEA